MIKIVANLININAHIVCASSCTLLTTEKTYQVRFENFRNVIIIRIYTVLNKIRIKFNSYNDNILYCHFLNFRCGSKDKLEFNGANFSNHVLGFVILFTTLWCILIFRSPKFRGTDRKIRPLIEIDPLCNALWHNYKGGRTLLFFLATST